MALSRKLDYAYLLIPHDPDVSQVVYMVSVQSKLLLSEAIFLSKIMRKLRKKKKKEKLRKMCY